MTWFNRMTEHWVVPQRLDLEQHVRRAGLQLVQTGTFGPQFYGLADDPGVDRGWVGMPFLGIGPNLDHMAELVPRLQAAGARVVGQMSMSWHYGDHQKGKGLFGNWSRIWEEYLPGTPSCATAEETQQTVERGQLRRWPIEGRPYFAYAGCMCNPHWLAMLGAMLDRAVGLGVDGVNVHHNFENFCACPFCRAELGRWLADAFDSDERRALFDTADLSAIDPRQADGQAPSALLQRHAHEVQRAVHYRRKAAFDEVFVARGRALKPDLLLAQWYHKYDFGPQDERSLLAPDLWAKDEDYIWYSQGGHKGASARAHGYVADMGLPARFAHAAGGGRPFVLNKYDSKRWRLSIAEGAANHFAAPAFHWMQEADETFALEDYTGPVYRYQRFLADQEDLIHPAEPFSQIGLVYPRRGELAADTACTDALRRLGRLLEDDHQLFDMLLDHQLLERDLSGYRLLLLPDIARLSPAEIERLRAFVEEGGHLLCSGSTAALDLDGAPHPSPPLPTGDGVEWLEHVPCELATFELTPGVDLPRVPELSEDPFGQRFLQRVDALDGGAGLHTDAPWWVRVRAWLPAAAPALVLHWVNYHQVEDSTIEVPCPEGPINARCPLPPEGRPIGVDWLTPERAAPLPLPHRLSADEAGTHFIEFEIPELVVYGLAVIHLQRDES